MTVPRIIPAGTRYGRLVVAVDRHPGEKKLLVRCDCGTEKLARLSNLENGYARSCGCLRRERVVARSTSHGMAYSPEYAVWAQMVQRCTNPKQARFADYGGRGIDVDPRWLKFEAFIEDMGDRPAVDTLLTLERIDNDRGYWPDNCTWATYSQQVRNRRGHGQEGRERDVFGRFLPRHPGGAS